MSITLRIKQAIIDRLCLEVTPDEIDDAAPLFREGLGLDSIDALEVVIALSKEFGITMRDEDMKALASVNSIAAYVLFKRPELASAETTANA
jgi:acyl carrier protein